MYRLRQGQAHTTPDPATAPNRRGRARKGRRRRRAAGLTPTCTGAATSSSARSTGSKTGEDWQLATTSTPVNDV